MNPILWWAVAAVNVVTFFVFGWDKWRARRGGRRVPEATLWWLTFATGLVGAWTAMSVFRHKTRKSSFRTRMWWITVLNPLWVILWAQFVGF